MQTENPILSRKLSNDLSINIDKYVQSLLEIKLSIDDLNSNDYPCTIH